MELDPLHYSLSGLQMLKLNPDAKLIKYTDLYKYNNIDDLFKNTNKLIILYLLKNDHYGHWTCLMKKKGYYEYFDPFGVNIDEEFSWISNRKRKELNEQHNYLFDLLKKGNKKIIYNNIDFQGEKTMTCGMHTSFRLINYNLTLRQYIEKLFLDKNINNPDLYVSNIILNKLF